MKGEYNMSSVPEDRLRNYTRHKSYIQSHELFQDVPYLTLFGGVVRHFRTQERVRKKIKAQIAKKRAK